MLFHHPALSNSCQRLQEKDLIEVIQRFRPFAFNVIVKKVSNENKL